MFFIPSFFISDDFKVIEFYWITSMAFWLIFFNEQNLIGLKKYPGRKPVGEYIRRTLIEFMKKAVVNIKRIAYLRIFFRPYYGAHYTRDLEFKGLYRVNVS